MPLQSNLLIIEPTHEIMALIASVNSIFKHVCAATLGLHICYLIGPFVFFHTLCVQTAKALARLQGCALLPELSLFAYAISQELIRHLDKYHNLRSWLNYVFPRISTLKISNQHNRLHLIIAEMPTCTFEPEQDKSNKMMCTQQRLGSAWAST